MAMIIRAAEVATEQLGDKPVFMKTLLTRTAHTEAISVTWVELAGRCCQQMACELSDRVYYVLRGVGEFQVGEDPLARVGTGDLVFIRKGVPYAFSGDMAYLVINVPAFAPGSDLTIE
jgi:mannose-6-phosphate isomerase-like protein (cupin superfamily)